MEMLDCYDKIASKGESKSIGVNKTQIHRLPMLDGRLTCLIGSLQELDALERAKPS